MARFNIWHVLLALFAAVAGSDQHQVHSVSVSRRSAHASSSQDSLTPSFTTVVQSTLVSTAIILNDHSNRVMSLQNAITTSVSKKADTSNSVDSTAGADAVRTAASSREWISSILDTVVMAPLGLASIVIAVILGRKQLLAMSAQLQLMLDIAHGRPRASHIATDDLELGQHNSNPDGSRVEARSEISSVNPAAQQADPSNGFAGFLPEPQPHVVGDDLQAQLVRYDEPAGTRPERPTCGDNFPNDEIEQDEGQTLEDTSAGSSCSHLGRQDSNGLNLDGPSASHPDDRMQVRPQFINGVDPAQQAIVSTASGATDSFPDTQHHVFGDDQLPQAARNHGPMNVDVVFHGGSEQRGDEGQASEETPSCTRLDRPDSTTLDLELECRCSI